MPNYFFIIFILTIIVTRVINFAKGRKSPTIFKFRLHHYMYGILLILISIAIKNQIIYAIGLGLLVDEIPQFFTGKWDWKGYKSYSSLFGLFILVILVYIFRDSMVNLII